MLPIPNIPSSGNENDSDDFSIINTPSPQPNDNEIENPLIPKIKESEEIDDFENISVPNLSNINNKSNTAFVHIDDTDDTNGEQSEFDIIDIPSNNTTSSQSSQTENESSEHIIPAIKPIIPQSQPPKTDTTSDNLPPSSISPEPSSNPSNNNEATMKSFINLNEPSSNNYGEQKLELLTDTKSPSASPKATMDEIINFTEPLSSSSDLSANLIPDGPIETTEEDVQPLINEVINERQKGINKKKKRYQKKEYESYISDKSNETNEGCNGYLCCKMQSINDNNGVRKFFNNVSCLSELFSNYMDKCFGGDQFNDSYSRKI